MVDVQKNTGEDRRTKLALFALQIFLEKGYSGASMSAVAKAAGIKKPSLYHHFSSKEQLFLAALAADLDPLCSQFDQLMEQPEIAPEALFRGALGLYYDAMVNSAIGSIMTVISETSQTVPEVAEGFHDDFIAKFETSLAEVYAPCRTSGTYRNVPDVTINQLVFGPLLSIAISNKMFANVPRVATHWSKGRSRAEFIDMVDGLLRV